MDDEYLKSIDQAIADLEDISVSGIHNHYLIISCIERLIALKKDLSDKEFKMEEEVLVDGD